MKNNFLENLEDKLTNSEGIKKVKEKFSEGFLKVSEIVQDNDKRQEKQQDIINKVNTLKDDLLKSNDSGVNETNNDCGVEEKLDFNTILNDKNIFKFVDNISEHLNTEEFDSLVNTIKNYKKYNDIKEYLNKIIKVVNEIKQTTKNYHYLDEEDKKRIFNDVKKIKKEQLGIIKDNFMCAVKYFNELNQDNQDYFNYMNNSISQEINYTAHKKSKKEKQKELIKDLFDRYITKVDITFDYIMAKMVNSIFNEKEIQGAIRDILNDYYYVLEVYDNSDKDIRQQYYEVLNDKTKLFYAIIDAYNELANSSISILKSPISLSNKENEIDLNNTVLAIADDKLDLYQKIHYHNSVPIYGNYNDHSYNEGDIYIGIINEDIAIKKTHMVISDVNIWAQNGGAILHNNHMYYANVNQITPIMNYNSLRDEMYKKRMQIVPYFAENKTDMNELLDVIDYGTTKFGLKQEKQKIK